MTQPTRQRDATGDQPGAEDGAAGRPDRPPPSLVGPGNRLRPDQDLRGVRREVLVGGEGLAQLVDVVIHQTSPATVIGCRSNWSRRVLRAFEALLRTVTGAQSSR